MSRRARCHCVSEQASRRSAIGDHGGRRAPHDAGLFSTNRLAVVAKPGLVVEVDAHDQRAVGIHRIDRIQSAAHADLENRDVGLATREMQQRRDRGIFEIGQRHRTERALDALEDLDELYRLPRPRR